MEGKLLLISSRPEDVSFWGNIADENGLEFHCEAGCAQVTHVREQLLAHPGSYVFWEADPPAGQSAERDAIEAELIVRTSPERVFALSDGPINQEPGLTRPPAFGHHILRRYDGPAPYLYSRLIASTVSREHFGLERFLPRVA
ncbi:MAG: hypothetical protein NDJ90_14805, partial [Oligoflexia bacterium]|nr:hypothetical protein [Oligoflexia bacterium]